MIISKKQTVYLLAAILLLGAFLRFYNLAGESFWLDEGTTGMTIKKYDALGILNNVIEKGQTLPDYYSQGKYTYDEDLPLYYMILRWWANIFGFDEFSLRSFSAIFGILSIGAVFYLARYLFDERIGLLAALFSSINLTLIWYSQEARQYSYLLFLSLLSVIFLVRALREKKVSFFIGLIIVNAFIIYSHLPWLIFITFEGIYALYILYQEYKAKKVLDKKIIIAFLILGLMHLPIIGRALFSQAQYASLFGRPSISSVAEFGVMLSTWLYPSVSMREKILSSSFFDLSFSEWALFISVILIALLVGILFIIGAWSSFKKRDNSSIFILLFFFFPFLFALLLSIIHPTITVFMIRQLIYLIPAYLIIAAIGCLRLKWSKIVIALIVILSIMPLYAYYANVDKQEFREAVKYIPPDEKLFLSIETAQVVFQYYSGEKENVIGVEDLNDLKSKVGDVQSFWVLLTFTKYSDPDNSIRHYLDKNYNLIEKKSFFDMEVLHYRK